MKEPVHFVERSLVEKWLRDNLSLPGAALRWALKEAENRFVSSDKKGLPVKVCGQGRTVGIVLTGTRLPRWEIHEE